MTKLIDLSVKEVQGYWGHDRIDKLDELGPGRYKLPFVNYDNLSSDGIKSAIVNVLYVTRPTSRMQCIIAEIGDGGIQDFYYNGNHQGFKRLTVVPEDEVDPRYIGTLEDSWRRDEIEDEVPEEYKKIIPPYNHKFFREVMGIKFE